MKQSPVPWVAAFRDQLVLYQTQVALSGRSGLAELLWACDQAALELPAHRLLARIGCHSLSTHYCGLTGPVEVHPTTCWLGGCWRLTQLAAHKRVRSEAVYAKEIVVAVIRGQIQEWSP